MKALFSAIAFAALLLCPLRTFAQMDGLKPGIYAVIGDQSIPLSFTNGTASVSGENYFGVEVTYNTYRFDGESSSVTADSTFILVIDPQKREVIRKMKEYDPFIKNMKPVKMLIIPFKINAELHCREYYQGKKLELLRVDDQPELDFEWDKLSDNSYLIKAPNLKPGEYGFVFKPEGYMGYDYTAIFGFTVPDRQIKQLN